MNKIILSLMVVMGLFACSDKSENTASDPVMENNQETAPQQEHRKGVLDTKGKSIDEIFSQ